MTLSGMNMKNGPSGRFAVPAAVTAARYSISYLSAFLLLGLARAGLGRAQVIVDRLVRHVVKRTAGDSSSSLQGVAHFL